MRQEQIRLKINAFIKKYYLNQLIRGSIICAAAVLGLFLAINIGEYFGRFNTSIRAVLFFGFAIVFIVSLGFLIINPLLKLYNIGKVISYDQAAKIIGTHFVEVKDKLLNYLQLEKMQISEPGNNLLLAGIEQKTKELQPIPFVGAINLATNKKYLRYLAIPVSLLLIILIFQNSIITDSTKRLVQFNTQFVEKAPFQFVFNQSKTQIQRGEDFPVNLQITGKAIPEDVFIILDGQKIKMASEKNNSYNYVISNIQSDKKLQFFAAGFYSEEYAISMQPLPSLEGVEVQLQYPAYTGKIAEKLNSLADITVAQGTSVIWNFVTKDVKNIEIIQNGTVINKLVVENGASKFSKQFNIDANYSLKLLYNNFKNKDDLVFGVHVTPDAAPGISVEKTEDTVNSKQLYFTGNASDDYGINAVYFKYSITQSEIAARKNKSISVSLPLNGKTETDFYYILNQDALGLQAGEEVEYYFEVWDNDAINGSKSARTSVQTLRKKTINELKKESNEMVSKMNSMMQSAMQKNNELQKVNKQLQQQISSKKNVNWNDKEQLKDLFEKQEKLQKELEKIKKDNDKLKENQNEFSKPNEEIKKQEDKLNELLKKLDDPEMKKLLEEIKKLLEEKANKDNLREKLNELNEKNIESQKDLDQLKEQFKELQLEKKMEENIDALNKIAEKMEKLSAKASNADKKDSEKLAEEQKKLEEEFNKVKEEIKKAEELNKDLEKPKDLDMGKQEQQQAEGEMQQAKDNLDKKKNSKASQNQKNAAQKMKEQAEKMKKSMDDAKNKQMEEDYETIRELLENLLESSFEQEDVFEQLKEMREYSPKVVALNGQQMQIKEKCTMMEDSLRKLAKRQPMVSTFITKEIAGINNNMKMALDDLKVRSVNNAAMREQYIMTGLNNLAVMLLESMQNMQSKMNQNKDKKPGKGSCKNPGGQGNKSAKGKTGRKPNGKLSGEQEALGKMLMALQAKKNGKQGEKGKEGDKDGKEGKKEINKEFAKMALMQEALRKQLNELKKEAESQGEKGKQAAKELQKTEEMMDKQEKDLINRKITPEMIQRQKEIETRLLEHEKAERTQEQDEQRQANPVQNYAPTLPPQLKEYIEKKRNEREGLRKNPPELTPYFRQKVGDYLKVVR